MCRLLAGLVIYIYLKPKLPGYLLEKVILGLPSKSAHPPSLNTGSPGCLADNILDIGNVVYPYLTISD